MTINLWSKFKGVNYFTLLNETVWRIVEAQEAIATRKLVDSLPEQIQLEEMIESTKPILANEVTDFHPLLYTPFRYPPLKYGSRFGRRSEPSLWYGSIEIDTAMAEMAFYRFNFLRASKAVYDIVETPLTAFTAEIKTNRGIKLDAHPFSDHTQAISSPISYEASQMLGTAMQQANVEAFSYQSARDPKQGANIAAFTLKAFLHKKPQSKSFQSWQCVASEHHIEFIRSSAITSESKFFPIDMFLIDNKLPFPAD